MGPLNNLYRWSLDDRVLNKLKETGFDTLRGFNKYLSLNIPLINVLISRYDADTRSFKLGSAENPFNIAFGLEDVLYVTGLPIDGKPVTGVDPKDVKSVCQRYLGKHKGYGRHSDINMGWLKENFMTLPVNDENFSEEELGYHVRAYVLYVIGCTFSPGSHNMVRAMFLPLLENVDDIGSYAWGAAFLAAVHDSIENSIRYSIGLYFPLMVFAYLRFPGLSSTIEIDRTTINAFPLAVSWSHALGLVTRQHFKNQDEEKLKTFFDNLKEVEKEVKWQPYGELSSNFLPQHLRKQVVLSKSRTILICFEKAVYHRPDKRQRQLGLAGHILKGQLIEIKTQCRMGKKGYDWSMNGKYVDYISEWDKRYDLLIDRDDDASLVETVAELWKENGKSKEEIDNRKNFPELVNRLSCIDNVYFRRKRIGNVDVDHQSPGDTTSSRVRNLTEIRSCHPQVEVSSLAGLRKAAWNTSACETASESFSLNIENTVSNAATLPPQTPVPRYKELVTVDTEAGLSTRKKSKKRKKTSYGGCDFPSSWEHLSREELAAKVWKKLKQADSTNKELQQQIITLQSANQALQVERQKLEASDSQKDKTLMQPQKNQIDFKETEKRFKELADGQDILAIYNPRPPAQELANAAPPDQAKASDHPMDVPLEENAAPDQAEASYHTNWDENVALVVAEIGSGNDDDACSEKKLVLLDNQDPENDSCQFEEAALRADALLIAELRKEIEKLKEEARLAEISLIAELRKENEKLKEENEHYRRNFPEHVSSRVDNVDVDHQSPAGDTTSSRVRHLTEIRSCHPQMEAINVKKQRVAPSTATTTTTTNAGVVDRAEPPLIIIVESDSDSDNDVSITDSFMDALVGTSKKVVK